MRWSCRQVSLWTGSPTERRNALGLNDLASATEGMFWHAPIRAKSIPFVDRRGAFTVNQVTVPHAGFMRIKGVLSIIPVSRATLYAGIKAGKYPKPIKLSEGVSVWRVADIDALCHQIEQQAVEVQA